MSERAKRILAVLAFAPAAYVVAFACAVLFYGTSQSVRVWSWPTVFVVATWIFGAAAAATVACLLAKWGYEQLAGDDRG